MGYPSKGETEGKYEELFSQSSSAGALELVSLVLPKTGGLDSCVKPKLWLGYGGRPALGFQCLSVQIFLPCTPAVGATAASPVVQVCSNTAEMSLWWFISAGLSGKLGRICQVNTWKSPYTLVPWVR